MLKECNRSALVDSGPIHGFNEELQGWTWQETVTQLDAMNSHKVP